MKQEIARLFGVPPHLLSDPDYGRAKKLLDAERALFLEWAKQVDRHLYTRIRLGLE